MTEPNKASRRFQQLAVAVTSAVLLGVGCGGGGGGGSSSSSGSGASTGGSTTSSSVANGHLAIQQAAFAQKAGVLAQALGRSRRLLIGLGSVDVAPVLAQGLKPDISDQYLTGVGTNSWRYWNSPAGAYVGIAASNAASMGAIPMFTLYQMAARGDGDLSGLSDANFMNDYWSNVRLLFQQLAVYAKPALVNLEPDFWGYTQRVNTDPTKMPAFVNTNVDCAQLTNTVTGVAQCLLQMARLYAPNAYVGFPPSMFEDLVPTEVAYMQNLVAPLQADFTVLQTLDRDAGCFEAQSIAGNCIRAGSGWYWDESNLTTPNFNQYFAESNYYSQGLQLPVLWWQTPMGVPAASPSKTRPWRDNRERYFFNHTQQIISVGGVGVVFSAGEATQTSILTDGGQFQALSKAYLANPTALP